MKKHAYLIIAHHEPNVLKSLLTLLDDERNDIFLHIDNKADKLYHQFKYAHTLHANLYVIENRISTYWGDISQVKVEFLLLEEAMSKGEYTHYHLLSGVDLPIQSQDKIHAFFDAHPNKQFVSFWMDKQNQKDLRRKVGRYYLFTHQLKNKKDWTHHPTAFIRNLTLGVQKVIQYERKSNLDFKKGSNWFSITHEFASYVLSQKEEIFKRFNHTLCPDEIFLQTLLWNSKFKDQIFNPTLPDVGSLRLIDWERGKPYVWREEDWHELENSPLFFARKFSSKYSLIVQRIQEYYMNKDAMFFYEF